MPLHAPAVEKTFNSLLNAPVTCRASVIIVNYNGRDYIGDCLESLLTHSSTDTEIIVVDNASTDGSADYIEEEYPFVQLVRSTKNGGFSHGNNLGVGYAHGEFLVFLNPDTAVSAGWLENLLSPLIDDPTIGMTTSKILLLRDPKRINACGNTMHLTGLTLCRGVGASAHEYNDMVEVNAVSGAAFAIRASLFKAVGEFDELMFMYMDDTDLSLRVRLAGYKCMFVPTSIVYHDYALRFGPNKTYYQERNRYIMLLKTLHWRTIALLAPAFLLGEAISWGFVLLREKRNLTNKSRAYLDVINLWPEIMLERRKVQSRRQVGDREMIAKLSPKIEFEQTGKGLVAAVAHTVFDPLFLAIYRLAMTTIRW
jgi:hypothetical protein